MKTLGFSLAILMAGVLCSVEADAQRRPVRRTTPKVVTSNVTQVRTGAEKVSIQIKNVTKFIYVLGGVASGIEIVDKDPRANQAARSANEQNKRDVLQAIRNLRAGLAALEVEFRTNNLLKRHLVHIQGITALSAQTENLASSGEFIEAGKPLLLVVEQLSDTLAAM
jgi:hypothetical protein